MSASSDVLVQQVIDRFWETVPPLWNTVRTRVRSTAIHQYDISEEQFHILRQIHRGVTSVSELAELGCISRPAMSQAVDALVQKQLVSRQTSDRDRRYIQLELTQAGQALLEAAFGQTRAWMRSKLDPLPPEELRTITRALAALHEAICAPTQAPER
jgi:DNA-binding MarR family transcriptional regulator